MGSSRRCLLNRLLLLVFAAAAISPAAAAAACVDAAAPEAAATITAGDSCQPQFDAAFTGAGSTVALEPVEDAFDRVSWQEEKHNGATTARRTDFNFLGLTGEITTETQSGSATGTKSYSYDAFGQRVGISSGGSNYTYGRNSHTDISLLIGETGSAQASYAYTPYGSLSDGISRGDKSTTAPLNPFRFNDKRYDSGSGSIDMGARRYGPDTARFLSHDFYRDALADLELATDPLTQNRYSYAGGNPTSFLEADGHGVDPTPGDARNAAKASARAKAKSRARANAPSPWQGGRYREITLKQDMKVTRYYGGASGRVGRWVTPEPPVASRVAKARLALPPANSAQFVTQPTIPAGTVIRFGTSASNFGHPGGGLQIEIRGKLNASWYPKGTYVLRFLGCAGRGCK